MLENRTYRCGCNYEFEHGATICRGCQGAIVYGATEAEIRAGRGQGAVIVVAAAGLILGVLPQVLNLYFQWHIPPAWGLGYVALLVIFAAAWWGGTKGVERALEAKRGLIRTFPRR